METWGEDGTPGKKRPGATDRFGPPVHPQEPTPEPPADFQELSWDLDDVERTLNPQP